MKISCKNGFNVIYGFRSLLKWIMLMNLRFNIQYIKTVKKYQTCQRGSKKIKHPRTLDIQTRETKHVHTRATRPPDVHTRATRPPDVHTRATRPPDVHTRATRPPDVHTRATRPPDEKDTFLNDDRRLTHNHRLVKYMYMYMRRCDARL